MSSIRIKNNDYSTKEYKNFIKVKKVTNNSKIIKKTKSIKKNSNFKQKEKFNIPKIKDKQIIKIEYKDKSILLTFFDNKFFAFSEKCPHLGISLKNGFILIKKLNAQPMVQNLI